MKRAFLSLVFAFLPLALAPACIIETDDDPEASLTLVNESDFVIDEFRVTPTGDPDFGPNLVGPELLFPGEEITVFLDCDVYDVLVVDETGLGCELIGVDLCFRDEFFFIDNTALEDCDF